MLDGNYMNKNVLVIGMGLSGRSAAKLLLQQKAKVLGLDSNIKHLSSNPEIISLVKQGLKIGLDSSEFPMNDFDFVILSPGISQNHFLIKSAKKENVPIFGEIELGCQIIKKKALAGKLGKVIGITGTNGKTTVTLFLSHLFNQCGQMTHALGNVGVPLTEELIKFNNQESIILELSSYQLETLQQEILDSGVILNITPDHLDRYKSMEVYAQAKLKIISCLKKNASLYVHENTWKEFSYLTQDFMPLLYGYEKTSFIFTDLTSVYKGGKKMFDLPQTLAYKKSIDLENLLAAYAVFSEKEWDNHLFLKAWESFKKPPHRMQIVAHFQGVEFIDDSKGTNSDAVIRAVDSIHSKIVLIAGGVCKGASFKEWIRSFKNKVKLVCTIGQAADKIGNELAPAIPVLKFQSLEEAVKIAFASAKDGEKVLLSPGCASTDMFRDYAHRGEEFQKIVLSIVGQKGPKE